MLIVIDTPGSVGAMGAFIHLAADQHQGIMDRALGAAHSNKIVQLANGAVSNGPRRKPAGFSGR
jgi:hypothetical protein